MESTQSSSSQDESESISFLPSPQFKKLFYLEKTIPLYANLYKIVINKNSLYYEYSIKFMEGEIENSLSVPLKHKILRKITRDLAMTFGSFVLAGDILFSTINIKEVTNKEIKMNKYTYSILFYPTKNTIELNSDHKIMSHLYSMRPEIKTILEVIIKEILKHNPSLKFVKSLYGKKSEEKVINASQNYNNVTVIPGFTTSVVFLEEGIFLNVDIKSKIVSSYNCLYLLNTFITKKGFPTKEEMKQINDYFTGRIVEMTNTNQRFTIEMVNFEKRAKVYEMKYDNKSLPIIKFYKNVFDIEIEPTSPLFLMKNKGDKSQLSGKYYPPELCLLVGLTEDMQKDSRLLKNMINEIKLCPDDKVSSIRDIMKLVNEKRALTKKRQNKVNDSITVETLPSSYEKKIEFGIDIVDVTDKSLFTGSSIVDPKLLSYKGKVITNISKPFVVYDSKKINYLCIYHKLNEKEKKLMVEYMHTASKAYGILIGKSDSIGIDSENGKDWIDKIEKVYNSSYNVLIVLVDEYLKSLGIYQTLKTHSLETRGYTTQFISTNSLYKNSMSVFSNILIQINTKIGGISYKVDFDKEVLNKKLMIIGVNTSKIEADGKKKTLMAICSTINKELSQYTQKKLEIDNGMNNSSCLPLYNAILEALGEYFKLNKHFPGGIVIYRQGVSQQQKNLLENEVKQVDSLLKGSCELLKDIEIPYYYILVNKKSSLKLFEYDTNGRTGRTRKDAVAYDNPDPGLLVYKTIVNPHIFEFFIQPQKVNSGSATPTNFHVAYGNMNCPEMIPKLTYDLCFLYSNWRGPVRVPAPLKYAEKLSKVEQKLNIKIKNTLSYI